MPLVQAQVERYMRGFIGYGSPTAHWWFFGTEEGGGTSMEEVEARVQVWLDRGGHPVEHLRDYSLAVRHGLNRWFCAELRPPTQSTWRPLIRAMLTARGIINNEHPDAEQLEIIRRYQTNSWGSNGETFLSEVLPLPAQGAIHWNYAHPEWWNNNPPPNFVATRAASFEHSSEARRQLLRAFIRNDPNQHRVIIVYASVVCDGVQSHEWLFETLGIELPVHQENIWIDGNLIVAKTRHPTGLGITTDYWNGIAQRIAQLAIANGFIL